MREIHKQYLEQVLEQITFKGRPLPVYQGYTTDSTVYPYCFIGSGQIEIRNESGGYMLDNGTYQDEYEYVIRAVFRLNADASVTEAEVDQLENLIKLKLREKAVRDNPGYGWDDLVLKEISAPFGDPDNVQISDNDIFKDFSIGITQQETYN
jgi:hypothetical protein